VVLHAWRLAQHLVLQEARLRCRSARRGASARGPRTGRCTVGPSARTTARLALAGRTSGQRWQNQLMTIQKRARAARPADMVQLVTLKRAHAFFGMQTRWVMSTGCCAACGCSAPL
jgi:hypothetical protein